MFKNFKHKSGQFCLQFCLPLPDYTTKISISATVPISADAGARGRIAVSAARARRISHPLAADHRGGAVLGARWERCIAADHRGGAVLGARWERCTAADPRVGAVLVARWDRCIAADPRVGAVLGAR
jgi:hypothetical protein